MRSSTYIALFASAAAAQESATVLALVPYGTALTYVTSDASATTFTNSCPPGSEGFPTPTPNDSASITPLSTDGPAFITLSPIPTPTGQPLRLHRRQDNSNSTDGSFSVCEPYTLISGPSTYGIHLTDPMPGLMTLDAGCTWTGDAATADWACTVTQAGEIFQLTESPVVETSTLSGAEVSAEAQAVTVALTTGSAAATGSVRPTRTGAGAESASSSAPGAQSTGMALGRAVPTGKVAVMGGAVGVLAAALAL